MNKALRRIIRDCNYEVFDSKQKRKVFLPKFSNHVLRHTFATRTDQYGVNNKVIQSIMGHSSPIITDRIYKHATEDFKKAEIFDFYESVKKLRGKNIEGKVV